ncbi:hypothetical protein FUAX_15450 [Fulvitalea axinellae]|uniref:LPXTG cell wall anchor domain-containing protein n=2 Tax=Fulvitalea axinellae TaxID=1182444 RepID=A0AAU9CZH9_9BACT|nr:hypothetical protein FUAX_15450 [Fulvitalea axinellae]
MSCNWKKTLLIPFILSISLFLYTPIHAQGPEGDEDSQLAEGNGPAPPDPNHQAQNVPIDGGVTLLIGAGIGLGVRKFIKKKD